MPARKFVRTLAWNEYGQLVAPAPTQDFILASDLPAEALLSTGSYADPAWLTALSASKLTGTLPTSVLPSLAISDVFTAASQAAMLALTAQRGDVAVRTDTGERFILSTDNPGTLADWISLGTPGDGVLTWNGLSGAVSVTTTNLPEGTNLYYTNARADARIAAAVGATVQGYDATLATIAALNPTTDQFVYFTATNAAAVASITSFGRSLVAAASAAAALTLIGGTGLGANTFTGLQTMPSLRVNGNTEFDYTTTATDSGGTIWYVGDGTNPRATQFYADVLYGAGGGGQASLFRFVWNNATTPLYFDGYGNTTVGGNFTSNYQITADIVNPGAISWGYVQYVGNGTTAAQHYMQQRLVYSGAAGVDSYAQWMWNGGSGTQMMTLSRWGNLQAAGWISSANVGMLAPVTAWNANAVGGTIGNGQQTIMDGGSSGNTVRRVSWLRRVRTGTDWTSIAHHDAIDVDGVWWGPTTGRCFYERDLNLGTHKWGDVSTDYMQLTSTSLQIWNYTANSSVLWLTSAAPGRGPEIALQDTRSGSITRYMRNNAGNLELINNAYNAVRTVFADNGDISWTGTATGGGAGLTNLNASNIATGTVPAARLGPTLQSMAGGGVLNGIPYGTGLGNAVNWIENYLDYAVATAGYGFQPFRLTTETGVGASLSDRTAQTTIYLTRVRGGLMQLVSGGKIVHLGMSGDISLALGAGLVTGKNYDIFLYLNAGVATLFIGPSWTNDTTRAATGVLTRTCGMLTLSTDTNKLWVGTIRATSGTTTEDSAQNRFVFSAYNKVRRKLRYYPGVAGNDTNTAWHVRSTNDQIRWVDGDAENTISAMWQLRTYGAVSAMWAGIAVDNTTPTVTLMEVMQSGNTYSDDTSHVYYEDNPGVGFHYLQGCIIGATGGSYDLSQGGYGFTGSIFN